MESVFEFITRANQVKNLAEFKLAPITTDDQNGVVEKVFTTVGPFMRFLDSLQIQNFSKNSVKLAIRNQLYTLLYDANTAFALAHGEIPAKAPARDAKQVDAAHLTVICLYDAKYAVYLDIINSVFLSSGTGKQAPGSGQTLKSFGSDVSTGDVQVQPMDSLWSLINQLRGIRNSLRNRDGQEAMDTRFGYTAGTANVIPDEDETLTFFRDLLPKAPKEFLIQMEHYKKLEELEESKDRMLNDRSKNDTKQKKRFYQNNHTVASGSKTDWDNVSSGSGHQ